MSPDHVRDFFDRNVSEEFQKRTIQLLVATYGQTLKEVRERYQWPEDVAMWGHERRARFDRDWRALADSFAPNIIGTIESNATANHHFTRIRSGRVIMTACAVDEKYQIPRPAIFRDTYTRPSQLTLFPTEDGPADDALMYAILAHAPGRGALKGEPSLVKIVFPLSDGSLHELKIDLLERFLLSLPSPSEETITPDVEPEIRIEGDDKKGTA